MVGLLVRFVQGVWSDRGRLALRLVSIVLFGAFSGAGTLLSPTIMGGAAPPPVVAGLVALAAAALGGATWLRLPPGREAR